MSTAKLLFVCLICLMVAAPAAWGQAENNLGTTGILGFLDPRTGAFHPMPLATPEGADALAATTFGGTVNLTITITLKTTVLTNINCSMSVSALDGSTTFTSFSESNAVAATGTGTTRTCKLSIPYSWSLAAQATDNMTTSYYVFGSTGTTPGLPTRTSGRSPLDTRKVPANGTITTLTAAVTL